VKAGAIVMGYMWTLHFVYKFSESRNEKSANTFWRDVLRKSL